MTEALAVILCIIFVILVFRGILYPAIKETEKSKMEQKEGAKIGNSWEKCLILCDGPYSALFVVTDQKMWRVKHPEVAVSSKLGVNSKTFSFEFEGASGTLSKTVTTTKDASVVKRAAVGGVVAGGAGAVVGAISAADANRKGGVQKKTTVSGSEIFYPRIKYIKKVGGIDFNSMLYIDKSEPLPDHVKADIDNGNFEQLLEKIRNAKGADKVYKNIICYDFHLNTSRATAKQVITYIDKFTKGEDTRWLLGSKRVSLSQFFHW